jgi:putative alpha-1,2-mannosidase
LGFIPSDIENKSVSKALEYAYNDWCIAQMAKELGKTEDYNRFMERSKRYTQSISIRNQGLCVEKIRMGNGVNHSTPAIRLTIKAFTLKEMPFNGRGLFLHDVSRTC